MLIHSIDSIWKHVYDKFIIFSFNCIWQITCQPEKDHQFKSWNFTFLYIFFWFQHLQWLCKMISFEKKIMWSHYMSEKEDWIFLEIRIVHTGISLSFISRRSFVKHHNTINAPILENKRINIQMWSIYLLLLFVYVMYVHDHLAARSIIQINLVWHWVIFCECIGFSFV